jgi:hypothetical protein
MSDAEVAKKTGRKTNSVIKRRLRLGIPNRTPARHVWTRQEISLLGTMFDRKLAGYMNCAKYIVTSKRRALKIPAWQPR